MKGFVNKLDKVLGMIGLAKRAGKVSGGEFLCEKAIKAGEAKLVILASDASENTKKSITDSCRYYHVSCAVYGTKDSLGQFTGGGYKAVISINDHNFAKTIKEKMGNSEERTGDF